MDSTTLYIVIATIGVGILAFIVAYFLYRWVKKLPSDNETIEKVTNLFVWYEIISTFAK